MVLEVYVLARTIFKISEIQSGDTSPADRVLRVQAMIGSGLMARDTLIFTMMKLLENLSPRRSKIEGAHLLGINSATSKYLIL